MIDGVDAKGGAIGTAGGGAAAAAVEGLTGGLSRAAAVAGDTLRGIFGGLPWDMGSDAIVDAVAGGGEAAVIAVDVLGVIA